MIDEIKITHGPIETLNCKSHGDYQGSVSYYGKARCQTKCPECANEHKREEEKRDIEEYYKMLSRIGIPFRFKDKTFENFVADTEQKQAALAFAQDYANNIKEVRKHGRCALFLGRVGTGKTHLGVAICLHIIQENRKLEKFMRQTGVRFTSVSKMLRRIKDTYRKGSDESEDSAIAYFTDCDLLVVDEVGVQFGTEYEKNTLFEIINSRYEDQKPTILMSNLNAAEVKAYLGDRAFDRLRENGGQHVVFDWDSYRGMAAA